MAKCILKQVVNTWGYAIDDDGAKKFQHVEAENTMTFHEWDDVTETIAMLLKGAAGKTITFRMKVEEEEE